MTPGLEGNISREKEGLFLTQTFFEESGSPLGVIIENRRFLWEKKFDERRDTLFPHRDGSFYIEGDMAVTTIYGEQTTHIRGVR